MHAFMRLERLRTYLFAEGYEETYDEEENRHNKFRNFREFSYAWDTSISPYSPNHRKTPQ